MKVKQNKSKPRAPRTGKSNVVVKAPVAVSVVSRGSKPKMTSSHGNYVVSNKELVGTVTNGTSTGFVVTQASQAMPGYDANPTVSTMFPWLSRLAGNYEMYQFRSLKFDLVPANPTTSPGLITASFDYDFDDPVPMTKQELYGKAAKVSGPVWTPLSLSVSTADMHRDMPFKYCSEIGRSNAVEPRTVYSGFLTIGIDSTTANLTWDLWVSYTVELKLPEVTRGGLIDTVGNVPTDVAAVCDSSGYGTGRIVTSSVPTSNGLIKDVVPGVSCPQLVEAGKLYAKAYDIRALARGMLTLLAEVSVAGQTVNSLVSFHPKLRVSSFDYSGNLLGSSEPADLKEIAGSTSSSWTTAGNPVSVLRTFTLEALRTLYPSVRYLVPSFITDVGFPATAGTVKSGYRYEL